MQYKVRKRLLALLIIICLIFGLMPLSTVKQVFAAGEATATAVANRINAFSSAYATVSGNTVTITSDSLIDESALTSIITIQNGVTLEIPSGVTLTIKKVGISNRTETFNIGSTGEIHVAEGGRLAIENGSCADAIAVLNGGVLRVDGTLIVNSNLHILVGGNISIRDGGEFIANDAAIYLNVKSGQNGSNDYSYGPCIKAQTGSSFTVNGGTIDIIHQPEISTRNGVETYLYDNTGIMIETSNAVLKETSVTIEDKVVGTEVGGGITLNRGQLTLDNSTITILDGRGILPYNNTASSTINMLNGSKITIKDKAETVKPYLYGMQVENLNIVEGTIEVEEGGLYISSKLKMDTNSSINVKNEASLRIGAVAQYDIDSVASVVLNEGAKVINPYNIFNDRGYFNKSTGTVTVGSSTDSPAADALSAQRYDVFDGFLGYQVPQAIKASSYSSGPYYEGTLITTTPGIYTPYHGGAEGEHTYQWYQAEDKWGTNPVLIPGATDKDYTPVVADGYKYIFVETNPVGDGSYTGLPVASNPILIYPRIPVNNIGTEKTVTYTGETFDLSQIDLYEIDQNAGNQIYTIEAGGIAEGTIGIDNKTLTVTKAGWFVIGMTTEGSTLYEPGSKVLSILNVSRGVIPSPTGFKASAATLYGVADGKIIYLNPLTKYEYKKDGDVGYTQITTNSKGEITGLGVGDYVVRIPQTNLYEASADSLPITIEQPNQIVATTSVSGKVTCATGEDITMTLMHGNEVVGSANAVENPFGSGIYEFVIPNVCDGVYYIIADNGDFSRSEVVVIYNQSMVYELNIDMTKTNLQSTVEIKNNAYVAVEGFNDLMQDKAVINTEEGQDKEVISTGGLIEIKLISNLFDEKPVDADRIVTNHKIGMYLDLSVFKVYFDDAKTKLDEIKIPELTNNLKITMELPYGLQGKTISDIYRVHGETGFDQITDDPNEQEYFEQEGNILVLHVKKFSTYAFSYEETDQGGGNIPGGGDTSGGSSFSDSGNLPKTFLVETIPVIYTKEQYSVSTVLEWTYIRSMVSRIKNKTITVDFSLIKDAKEYTLTLQPKDLKDISRLILKTPWGTKAVIEATSIQRLSEKVGEKKFIIIAKPTGFYFMVEQSKGKQIEWADKECPILLFIPCGGMEVTPTKITKSKVLATWYLDGMKILKIGGTVEYVISVSKSKLTTLQLIYLTPRIDFSVINKDK